MKKNLMIFLITRIIAGISSAKTRFYNPLNHALNHALKIVLNVKYKSLNDAQKIKRLPLNSALKKALIRPKRRAFYAKPSQGVTLIEALVAIIVFSIGLLGMIKLLTVSSRLQSNMEYQLQANLIASNIREVLADASSGGADATDNPAINSFPAFIEGFLDGARCNASFQTCAAGQTARQSLNQQNQNLYSGNALSVNIGHGTLTNNIVNFTGNCHDPIFARIQFQTQAMQTRQNNNQARSGTVTYVHPVGQYRMIGGSNAYWGVGCN